MKRWSFDVRSGGPSQAAPLERENERAWKDNCKNVLARWAQWDQQGWPHSGRVAVKKTKETRVWERTGLLFFRVGWS